MAQLFDIRKVTVGPRSLTAVVELQQGAPRLTSEDAEGTERMLALLPELSGHVCLGDSAPHFGEVIANTELAHLLEHVSVELLARTNAAGDITTGRTVQTGERTYEIELSCSDDVLVAGALSSAVWIMQWAYSGGGDPSPDVDAIASGLVDLVASLPVVEPQPEAAPKPAPAPAAEPVAAAEPEAAAEAAPVDFEPTTELEPAAYEPAPEVEACYEPVAEPAAEPEPAVENYYEPAPVAEYEPVAEPEPEPVTCEPVAELEAAAEPVPVAEPAPEPEPVEAAPEQPQLQLVDPGETSGWNSFSSPRPKPVR